MERAVSKLEGSFSSELQTVGNSLQGFVDLVLSVEKIKVDKSIEGPKYICQACGSHLSEKRCKNCYNLMMGHNLGMVYFVVDHFNGQDYSVVFYNPKELSPESL